MKAASAGNNSERGLPAGQAGNSALEIIIALAILTIAMASIIQISLSNQTVSADSQVNNEALYKASATLEKARAAARQNFAGVISSTSADDIYIKELTVTDLTQCRKQIIASISWAADPQRPETITLTGDVTDVSGTLAVGGDCNITPPANGWNNPQTLATLDLGQGKSTGIDVQNGFVFLATEDPSAAKPDLYIADATDPRNPFILSSLNTGPSLNAVDAAGSYVYAANRGGTAGHLQVISISDMAVPAVIATRSLPGVPAATEAKSIFYYQSRAYIGAAFTAGHEFHIYDVANPANPTNLGHFEVGRNVNQISVRGTTAYLAVGSSAGDLKDMVIYNVANPGAISELGYINLPGGGGKSVYIVGNKLYLGCFKMSGKSDFYIIDISNPASPTVIGQKTIGADINGIRVVGNLAFLSTSDSNKEFQIWNISNPAAITTVSSMNFPQESTGVDYEDNVIYAAVRSNTPLRIITSNP